MNALLVRHYPMLLAYVRSKFRCEEADARDVVQSFVERKILLQKLLRSAHPSRGRFRAFLRTCLHRHAIDQLRQRKGPRGQPPGAFVPFEEAIVSAAVSREANGESAFDRRWALSVLEKAELATELFYQQKGRTDTWGVFRDAVLVPTMDGVERPSDEELARRHGFKTARQVSNAIITAKRQYGKILRGIVQEYLGPEEAVDEELRELMAALAVR